MQALPGSGEAAPPMLPSSPPVTGSDAGPPVPGPPPALQQLQQSPASVGTAGAGSPIAPMSEHHFVSKMSDEEEVDADLATRRRTPYKSLIECGLIYEGTRVYRRYIDYFGQEVEIFWATEDPNQTPLFRPSLIAKRLGCGTSPVGMYLHRKKRIFEGIFQATGFLNKQSGSSGLKVGAYLITIDVCRKIESHFLAPKVKRKKESVDMMDMKPSKYRMPMGYDLGHGFFNDYAHRAYPHMMPPMYAPPHAAQPPRTFPPRSPADGSSPSSEVSRSPDPSENNPEVYMAQVISYSSASGAATMDSRASAYGRREYAGYPPPHMSGQFNSESVPSYGWGPVPPHMWYPSSGSGPSRMYPQQGVPPPPARPGAYPPGPDWMMMDRRGFPPAPQSSSHPPSSSGETSSTPAGTTGSATSSPYGASASGSSIGTGSPFASSSSPYAQGNGSPFNSGTSGAFPRPISSPLGPSAEASKSSYVPYPVSMSSQGLSAGFYPPPISGHDQFRSGTLPSGSLFPYAGDMKIPGSSSGPDVSVPGSSGDVGFQIGASDASNETKSIGTPTPQSPTDAPVVEQGEISVKPEPDAASEFI